MIAQVIDTMNNGIKPSLIRREKACQEVSFFCVVVHSRQCKLMMISSDECWSPF